MAVPRRERQRKTQRDRERGGQRKREMQNEVEIIGVSKPLDMGERVRRKYS